MSENTGTTFSNKLNILCEFWLEYKHDEEFADFVSYNDLGLPLAYAMSNGIITETPLSKTFIEETFDLLLNGLDMEDTGFESLDDLLTLSEE